MQIDEVQVDGRESDFFPKKSTRYSFNLKWIYFYKMKGQDMPFELGIQAWKIMSFRWWPSSWTQFSILRLKSSIARANSCWSIVNTSCRMAPFNSFKLRGLWVYTRPFRYPQRKKSHTMTSQETLGAVAHRRNAKWGARGTCFEKRSLLRAQCALWHHPAANKHFSCLFVVFAVLVVRSCSACECNFPS